MIASRGHPTAVAPILDQSEDGWFGAHDGDPDIPATEREPVISFANHTCAVRFHTALSRSFRMCSRYRLV